jgi:ElaB/YqjD/DUF883 family membrane-anchored ribosome-binding protein
LTEGAEIGHIRVNQQQGVGVPAGDEPADTDPIPAGIRAKTKDRSMETHFDAMQSENPISREKVKDDLRVLMRDAEELLKVTAGDVSEKAKEARSRLAEAIEKAKTTCHRLEEKTVAAAKATDKAIREHPYESIGIAFGVGILLGVLIGRK